MNTALRNCLVVGTIVVALVVFFKYRSAVYGPNERAISNSEILLQEGDDLLKKNGNTPVVRRNLEFVDEGLAGLQLWYATPGHKAEGKRLVALRGALKTKFDALVASQEEVAAAVEASLDREEFEQALAATEGGKARLGEKDVVMTALDQRVRNDFYTHVSTQVVAFLKEGNHQPVSQLLREVARSSFGEDRLIRSLSQFAQRLSVQDFSGAQREMRYGPMADVKTGLQKEVEAIVKLGREANLTKQALIAEKVAELITATRTTIYGFPRVRGKVMVWDYTKKTVEQAYDMLRDDLRASPHDEEITIFGIRKRWDVTVGRYSVSQQPALREHMEIGVVYWPSMDCAGYAEVEGGQPPAMRTVAYVPGRGSSVSIKNWIEGH